MHCSAVVVVGVPVVDDVAVEDDLAEIISASFDNADHQSWSLKSQSIF